MSLWFNKFKTKDDSHSPDSFYEKLVEDIPGECTKCKKSVFPGAMEDHMNN